MAYGPLLVGYHGPTKKILEFVDSTTPAAKHHMSLVLLMPPQTKQLRHLFFSKKKIEGMRQRKGLQKKEDSTHVLLLHHNPENILPKKTQ